MKDVTGRSDELLKFAFKTGDQSWLVAAGIVNQVRPVPWFLWRVLHSVYGSPGILGQPNATVFSVLPRICIRAAGDGAFRENAEGSETKEPAPETLAEAIQKIGADVAASLCFIHAICRRISGVLSARIYRPIIDDALLRARIGYLLGINAPAFGPGRGMIAGFSGRFGLALQFAAGNEENSEQALSALASREQIGDVCRATFGCDPLQVSALTLVSAGCNRDMAFGISGFSSPGIVPLVGEQLKWHSAFTIIESVRAGRRGRISDECWAELDLDEAERNAFLGRVEKLYRMGHGWRWMSERSTQE